MISRTMTLLFCVLALAACGDGGGDAAGGGGEASAPPPRTAGHRRMVADLARIAARTPDEDAFLGDAELRSMEARLADLGPTASAEERCLLTMGVGEHHLRLGRPEVALEKLAAARSLLDALDQPARAEIEPQLLFRSAVASMRLGETANCVTHHGPESCLLPIREGGVHVDQRGSLEAMAFLARLLDHPARTRRLELIGKWLLNIAAMTVGKYPDGVPETWRIPPETWQSSAELPRFPNVAAERGLDTFNLSGGLVVEDFDGDGDLDVLTSTWDRSGPMRYFRNDGGRFVDRTSEAGLDGMLGGLNMIHADHDDDGDVDVFVLRGAWMGFLGRHPNSLLVNDGRGVFTDVTHDVGLASANYPTQTAAWADFDGDGDLDLFVGNEAGPGHDYPSQLFRNDRGRFTDVAAEAGVENRRYAKGAAWGDFDDDGDPDLYVSNLRGDNRLYRNDGGRFVDVAPALGVTGPNRSFPCWFFDHDQDGVLDIFVAAYVEDVAEVAASYTEAEHGGETARLYRGDGRGGFEDVSARVGLADRIVTTMGAGWGDLDGDGFPDIYLGTGFPAYEALLPNTMYLNRPEKGGRVFADVTLAGGFGHLQKGHAVVFADLDDDGDQDVFEQMGGAYRGDSFHDALYDNPGSGSRFVCLTLEGVDCNRSAIGARVKVMITEGGEVRTIHRVVGPRGSFGSAPLRLEIGIGRADSIRAIEVRWPGSEGVEVVRDIPLDTFLRLRQGDGAVSIEANRRTRK